MEKRNKFLLAVFLGIIVVNVMLLMVPDQKSSVSFDENRFVITDTASVQKVVFSGQHQVELTRKNGSWELNGRHAIDEGLHRLLLSIMQRVQVRRPVSQPIEGGTKVSIIGGDSTTFVVTGNATRTKTYFTQGDQTFEVEIPGYRDYLASIFELHPDQWRDRLVFNGSWRTIQKLELTYASSDKNGFVIAFKDQFFELEGVDRLDSSKVVDYLNLFQYLQAGERISLGRFARYDSLSKTQPRAILTIDDINYSAPQSFFMFPQLPGESFLLIKNQADEMMIFDKRRIDQILLERRDFELLE